MSLFALLSNDRTGPKVWFLHTDKNMVTCLKKKSSARGPKCGYLLTDKNDVIDSKKSAVIY